LVPGGRNGFLGASKEFGKWEVIFEQNAPWKLLWIIVTTRQPIQLIVVYSMLQNRKPNGATSPRLGEKITDNEGDPGRKPDERARAKSFGMGDEIRLRGAKKP